MVEDSRTNRLLRTRRDGPGQRFSIFTLLAQFLLIGLVTAAPWLFGGVEARVQVWLFAGVLLAVGCWGMVEVTRRKERAALPAAILPLIAALGLGIFQLVPLSHETTAVFSPATAELRRSLLPSDESAEAALSEMVGVEVGGVRGPLSVYPASTRRDLAFLVAAVAAFAAGAIFFRTSRAQLWLCGAVAVNGAALAFFGLVQQLSWNGMIYWRVPLTMGGQPFGPFVNRNNGAGFLLLSLACAVGLAVWTVGRSRGSRGDSGAAVGREGYRPAHGALGEIVEFIGQLNARTLAVLAVAACILGGIFCSLSRGAGLAVVGAAIVTVLATLCARGRGVRLWLVGLVGVAGLGLVGWVGMSGQVQARFATLLDQEVMAGTRIPHWCDGLAAAGDFWRLGSGLGTYRYVYRPYQERLSEAWYYHAENQYLEALVEAGVPGLGLMLLMIGLVGAAAWRLLSDDEGTAGFAFGVVGVFALASQAIHGFFDFGLYVPANVFLFAILAGAVSGRAVDLESAREAQHGPGAHATGRFSDRLLGRNGAWGRFLALGRGGLAGPLLAVLLLAGVLCACWETRRVAAVETALRSARFEGPPGEVSAEFLTDAMERVASALARRPDDAEAQHGMATLRLHLYRVRAREQLRRETGASGDDPRLWQATSQIVLHARAHHFHRNNEPSELERLRGEPVVEEHLGPSLAHLVLARGACPLLAEVHVTLGELSAVLVDSAADGVHIERARKLGPSDPGLLFRCGLLDLQGGRIGAACESWHACLSLSDRYLDDVLVLAGRHLSAARTVEDVLPESPALLVRLARERYQADEQEEMRRLLAERAGRLVDEVDLPEDERHYLRAAAFSLRGLDSEAIASLLGAVALRPGEASWRYEVAVLLKRAGRMDEAREQARLAARLAPRNSTYRALLTEINQARSAADG